MNGPFAVQEYLQELISNALRLTRLKEMIHLTLRASVRYQRK